jgi:YxiJ-like protein
MDVHNVRDRANTLAEEIERCYEERFKNKFPYDDCYKLQRENPSIGTGLIPDLDSYLSFIAGYSSSATTLVHRPVEELRKAISRLKRSFFEVNPRYKSLERLITLRDTAVLYTELQVANALRRDLLVLMEPLAFSAK